MNKLNNILSVQNIGKRQSSKKTKRTSKTTAFKRPSCKRNPVNSTPRTRKKNISKIRIPQFSLNKIKNLFFKLKGKNRELHSSVFITAGTIAAAALGLLLILSFVIYPGTDMQNQSDQEIFLREENPEEVGTGYTHIKRDTDIEYEIKKKDTLYELAYLYEVDVDQLVAYNNIKDVTKLMPGQKILIPSKDNAEKLRIEQKIIEEKARAVAALKPVVRPKSVLPAELAISAKKQSDGQSLTVNFSIDSAIDENQKYSYIWDFGDGKKAFHETTRYTYTTPGTYNVSCTIIDKYGYKKISNRLFIDIPHTGTTKNTKYQFITLNSTGGSFTTKGPVISINGQPAENTNALSLLSETEDTYTYQSEQTGYFFLVIETENIVQKISLFVSPVPSIHTDRSDINWYRTQFNTGMSSNCGPAAASMAISWATGNYVPVATIRQEVGWQGVGGTSMNDLGASIKRHGADYIDQNINQVEDIFGMIDKGHAVMILHHSGRITSRGDNSANTFFGRYYSDSVGHYIIIKGYSIDKKYFVVYDPLPGDWVSNSVRYADGISNLGRNRYYPVSEIKRSLRSNRVFEFVR